MNENWKINEIINLEYFIYKDNLIEDSSEISERDERDRNIYINEIKPFLKKPEESSGNIIKRWLESRKDKELKSNISALPGDLYSEVYSLIIFIFTISGFLSGISLTLSFLLYKGSQPVNISAYFSIFVLMQIVMVLLLILFMISGLQTKRFKRFSITALLLNSFFKKATLKIKNFSGEKISKKRKQSFHSLSGLITGKKQIYGTLFSWPLFIIVQFFGIGFNIGILGATTYRILSSDMAFGWQSTLKISSTAVFKGISAISSPWAWFVSEPYSHPTLSQIEGTRIILKDGINRLATGDLVSWWPFLILSVLFYGLFPRVIFLFSGLFLKKRALNNLRFDSVECETLLMRMRTPIVNFDNSNLFEETKAEEKNSSETFSEDENFKDSFRNLIVLLPDEISENCQENQLKEILIEKYGDSNPVISPVSLEFLDDSRKIADYYENQTIKNKAMILLIQEAWLPPIKEIVHYIKDLRSIVEKNTIVNIGLIGKPSTDTIFTTVTNENFKTWFQEINRLKDPYLTAVKLVR